MDISRINKRVFLWSDRNAGRGCKNHNFQIKDQFKKLELETFADTNGPFSRNGIISKVEEAQTFDFVADVNSESSRSGNGRNKLRTYRLFKSEYKVEKYCKLLLSYSHRSAFAKFRCGVALIRIETGRYENLAVSQRLCHVCNTVEDELHVILKCSLYNNLRALLFSRAVLILPNFSDLDDSAKLSFLFSNPEMIRVCTNVMLLRTNSCFRDISSLICMEH